MPRSSSTGPTTSESANNILGNRRTQQAFYPTPVTPEPDHHTILLSANHDSPPSPCRSSTAAPAGSLGTCSGAQWTRTLAPFNRSRTTVRGRNVISGTGQPQQPRRQHPSRSPARPTPTPAPQPIAAGRQPLRKSAKRAPTVRHAPRTGRHEPTAAPGVFNRFRTSLKHRQRPISGAGFFGEQTSTGTTTLTGANTYTGNDPPSLSAGLHNRQ